jgi:predicted XRE-type DNA-binding protein
MNERPDVERIKSELAAAIVRLIDERKLTDGAAAERLAFAETEVRRIRTGDLASFSIDQLLWVLDTLGLCVHVNVSPKPADEQSPEPQTGERPTVENSLLSLIEYMKEITAKIPPEELEKLPTDMAANHDHYLYGAPKRY